jgi:hypothetical protein
LPSEDGRSENLDLVTLLLVVLGVVASLYVLHLLATYAESRGWIFYMTRPPRVRMLGFLEEIVDPRVEYVVEEETSEAIRAEQDESGEGPQAAAEV